MSVVMTDLGARLMLAALGRSGPFDPSGLLMADAAGSEIRAVAGDLDRAGLVEVVPSPPAAVEMRVLNAGARALIAAGLLKSRELSRAAGYVLAYAVGGRRDAETGGVDPRLGDVSRVWVADRPHGRACAQLLTARGLVETLAPETEAELTWGRGRLILRATDLGMAA